NLLVCMAANRKSDGSLIGWTTITYRSVLLAIAVVLLVALGITYLLFPEQVKSRFRSMANAIAGSIGSPDTSKTAVRSGAQQANFTVLEGTVRVKRRNSNTWVDADLKDRKSVV